MARLLVSIAMAGLVLVLPAGCGDRPTGPIRVSAIGGAPKLLNPNLEPLDPPSGFLVEAAGQGLVRFDAAGEIEPALAQSWIVSDDGRRYTFRIRRVTWSDGSRVTAEQVAARLRAALSRASRNPNKPVLGAIQDVVAMTDQVLEISLGGPRPNFLQLLAQPELGILWEGRGTGPYRVEPVGLGTVHLSPPEPEDSDSSDNQTPIIVLEGKSAPHAIAHFSEGEADLVTGGTIGDLPYVRAADLPNNRLLFDPAIGMIGLSFLSNEGPFADPETRRALSMAIDRQAIVAALRVPGLQPRVTLTGPEDLPQATAPDWATMPMPARRAFAVRTIAALDAPLQVRVAIPSGPGYRVLFAIIRRDWRLIGVEARAVGLGAPADLRLLDAVAPAVLAPWYLRRFTCDVSPVCDHAADAALLAARDAQNLRDRRVQLASADRILSDAAVFIPLMSPVRWSLVAPRLTGVRPNAFARHPAATLVAEEF